MPTCQKNHDSAGIETIRTVDSQPGKITRLQGQIKKFGNDSVYFQTLQLPIRSFRRGRIIVVLVRRIAYGQHIMRCMVTLSCKLMPLVVRRTTNERKEYAPDESDGSAR